VRAAAKELEDVEEGVPLHQHKLSLHQKTKIVSEDLQEREDVEEGVPLHQHKLLLHQATR